MECSVLDETITKETSTTGEKLKAARVALGWSAPLVGHLTGYSTASIYAAEGGRAGSLRLVAALVEAYKRGNDASAWEEHQAGEWWRSWDFRRRRAGK